MTPKVCAAGDLRTAEHSLEDVLAEQRCQWMAGVRTPAATWLARCPNLAADLEAAAEVVYHEFLLRTELGEAPAWEEYLRAFPEHAAALDWLRQADQLVSDSLAGHLDDPAPASPDDYEMLELLGRGGMGVVYKARQKRLDRVVALKLLPPLDEAGDKEHARFLREARAVGRLQHPHIVQIYDCGTQAGRPFLALEYVEGASLARRLSGEPVSAEAAAALVEKLAGAMHYAHTQGIVHRDLKPANVLLAGPPAAPLDQCMPKVTDFGLAKRLDWSNHSRSGVVLGTPSYMAPEQIEPGGTADARTDVYGLGAILYELLTGRPPFKSVTVLHTLKQVLENEPVPARLLNPAVPRDLDTICLQCLRKEPDRRYPSAADLAADLRRSLDGKPIQARPVGVAGRGWRWCRRNRLVASLLCLAGWLLVGGVSGIAVQSRLREVARQDAVANASAMQEILGDLIRSSPIRQGKFGVASRPRVGSGVDTLIKAKAYCRRMLEQNPADRGLRITLTHIYSQVAMSCWRQGQMADADAHLREARGLWEPLVQAGSLDRDSVDWLATTWYWQARAAIGQRTLVQALAAYQAAIDLWQWLVEGQPGDAAATFKAFQSCYQLTSDPGDPGTRETLPMLEEDRTRLMAVCRREPNNRVARKRLALTNFLIADVYHADNRAPGTAVDFWREAQAQYQALAAERPGDLTVEWPLAFLAHRQFFAGDESQYAEATTRLRAACRQLEPLTREHPDWLGPALGLLSAQVELARCHARMGRHVLAQEAGQELLQRVTAALAAEQARPLHNMDIVSGAIKVASVL